jgi:hypothetical protein
MASSAAACRHLSATLNVRQVSAATTANLASLSPSKIFRRTSATVCSASLNSARATRNQRFFGQCTLKQGLKAEVERRKGIKCRVPLAIVSLPHECSGGFYAMCGVEPSYQNVKDKFSSCSAPATMRTISSITEYLIVSSNFGAFSIATAFHH